MSEPRIEEYNINPVTPVAVPVAVTKGPTKKRKSPPQKNASTSDLKQRARMLCGSPEQWRSVSRYGETKLQEWVEDREYDKTSATQSSIFDFVHRSLAVVLDTLSSGDGYVENEILADLSLKASIIEEMYTLVQFMTNKYKLIALTAADTVNAKRRQWKETPTPQIIIEEIPCDVRDEDHIGNQGHDDVVVADATEGSDTNGDQRQV
jgi:hypothetical protein